MDVQSRCASDSLRVAGSAPAGFAWRTSRVRRLLWAAALEAALTASIVEAFAGESWLVVPLVVLQFPGFVVAAVGALMAGSAVTPTHAGFALVMALSNLAAIDAGLRVADRRGSSPSLERLCRPYPNALPVAVLAAVVPLYMLIAAWTPGRLLLRPTLALDAVFVLQPAWSAVYASQWVFSFLPVVIVRGVELRRRVVSAYITIVLTAYAGFLAFPTAAPRPAQVTGDGFSVWTLRLVYDIDPPYNCFPSLHVAYSFLAALTAWRVHRRVGAAAFVWAMMIAFSTLYTKQHYVADVAGGALLAFAAYRLFLCDPAAALPDGEAGRTPRRALGMVAPVAGLIAALWLTYKFDW
jgi:membrane-associated phospholipid phosphatase